MVWAKAALSARNTKAHQLFISIGADVLVVAPTGMGKVCPFHSSFLARTWNPSVEHLLPSASNRTRGDFYVRFSCAYTG